MDHARDPDPRHHLAFLTWWASDCKRNGRFNRWDRDEILAEAYLQAHRLLGTLYDPAKSTVVTFLKAFLWGAVHYVYWSQQGYRFDDIGKKAGGKSKKILVKKMEFIDCAISEPLAKPLYSYTPFLELVQELTDEEWTIVRLRLDGYTMTQVAAVIGLKSPQSVQNRLIKIRGKLAGVEDATGNDTNTATEGPGEERPPLP